MGRADDRQVQRPSQAGDVRAELFLEQFEPWLQLSIIFGTQQNDVAVWPDGMSFGTIDPSVLKRVGEEICDFDRFQPTAKQARQRAFDELFSYLFKFV